jgi:hypothetical protein
MILTGKEIYQSQSLLPIQGNLKNLTLAAEILSKLNIREQDNQDDTEREIDFSKEEIDFLKEMISILDQASKLSIHGLSLYTKIMNIKE